MFLNDIVSMRSINLMDRIVQTFYTIQALHDLREMVMVLNIVHGTLQQCCNKYLYPSLPPHMINK